MSEPRPRSRRWLAGALLVVVLLVAAAALGFRGDIIRWSLDPHSPFQTYKPPPAPDYAERKAWLILPEKPETADAAGPDADIFFVAPTTFPGGRDWNDRYDDPKAERMFRRVMAPNYAGPFERLGRVFAPKYRQAGLFSLLSLSDDAKDARRFPYADVAAAFRQWRDRYGGERPFIVVGVEQGGAMAERLVAEEIAPHAALRARLAGAYLIETVAAATHPPLPPCQQRDQASCIAAWANAPSSEIERGRALLDRALVWDVSNELKNLNGPALCFNPILGASTNEPAPARMHLGAANATGLEWSARPGFLARQVSAQCEGGVLRVSTPKSALLKPSGSWIERRLSPGFNLFYADLEADARARLAALHRRP